MNKREPQTDMLRALEIQGERELLEVAEARRWDGWEDFRFRLLSAAQVQTPPFEHLLALDVARGVLPLEHQRGAVRQLLGRMRGRGILADEVGMGKTIEAGISLLELTLRGLVRKTLILAPPSLLGQ